MWLAKHVSGAEKCPALALWPPLSAPFPAPRPTFPAPLLLQSRSPLRYRSFNFRPTPLRYFSAHMLWWLEQETNTVWTNLKRTHYSLLSCSIVLLVHVKLGSFTNPVICRPSAYTIQTTLEFSGVVTSWHGGRRQGCRAACHGSLVDSGTNNAQIRVYTLYVLWK